MITDNDITNLILFPIDKPTDNDLKTIKGIVYQITNLINNKKYIGKTIKTFIGRYRYEWWERIGNRLILEDIRLYGHENFKIEFLVSNILDEELLYSLEEYFIAKLKTKSPYGYNLDSGGKFGNKTKCEEVYKLISESLKNYFKTHPHNHTGKKFPKEWIEKRVKSQEKEYHFLDKDNNLIIIKGITRFCKENNLCIDCMVWVAKGKLFSYKGFYSTIKKEKIRKKIKEAIFSHVNGEVCLVTNVIDFCKEKCLSYTNLMAVTYGKYKSHKGWKLDKIEYL